jgi:predicted enzyme related to lactoylglutathione lyase
VGLALKPAQGDFDAPELTLTVLDVTSAELPAAPPATGPGLSRNDHAEIELVALNPWSDGARRVTFTGENAFEIGVPARVPCAMVGRGSRPSGATACGRVALGSRHSIPGELEMIKKVAFVAQPTIDMESGKRFYGELLGLENTQNYENCWSEYQADDDVSIALDTFAPKHQDKATTYLALETDDIEAEVARLREAGVTIAKDVWTNEDHEDRLVCKMAFELAEWRRQG